MKNKDNITFDIKKIEKIKKKYNNINMSDETAFKIINLEKVNNALIAATAVCGIITFIDYIAPDPVPFVDEAVLTGVTSLLGTASGIVNSNIKKLANDESTEAVTINDVQKIVGQVNSMKKARKIK